MIKKFYFALKKNIFIVITTCFINIIILVMCIFLCSSLNNTILTDDLTKEIILGKNIDYITLNSQIDFPNKTRYLEAKEFFENNLDESLIIEGINDIYFDDSLDDGLYVSNDYFYNLNEKVIAGNNNVEFTLEVKDNSYKSKGKYISHNYLEKCIKESGNDLVNLNLTIFENIDEAFIIMNESYYNNFYEVNINLENNECIVINNETDISNNKFEDNILINFEVLNEIDTFINIEGNIYTLVLSDDVFNEFSYEYILNSGSLFYPVNENTVLDLYNLYKVYDNNYIYNFFKNSLFDEVRLYENSFVDDSYLNGSDVIVIYLIAVFINFFIAYLYTKVNIKNYAISFKREGSLQNYANISVLLFLISNIVSYIVAIAIGYLLIYSLNLISSVPINIYYFNMISYINISVITLLIIVVEIITLMLVPKKRVIEYIRRS